VHATGTSEVSTAPERRQRLSTLASAGPEWCRPTTLEETECSISGKVDPHTPLTGIAEVRAHVARALRMGCGVSSASSASAPKPSSQKQSKAAGGRGGVAAYSTPPKPNLEPSDAAKVWAANPLAVFARLCLADVRRPAYLLQLRAASLVQVFGRRVAARHKLRRKIRTNAVCVSVHPACAHGCMIQDGRSILS
jgi:hypothetical protein